MGSRRASEREAMSLRETALVTGCGSAEGIGFAAARLLARLGASVAITSTTAERLEARATELQRDGARVFRRVADLTDREIFPTSSPGSTDRVPTTSPCPNVRGRPGTRTWLPIHLGGWPCEVDAASPGPA